MVDLTKQDNPKRADTTPESQLVSWVTKHLDKWREYRENNFSKLWKSYKIKAFMKTKDDEKTRKSERSRLISPALAQAIELATAELEEAVFGKDGWFDLQDDELDLEEGDVQEVRRLLLSDIKENKLDTSVADTFYLGALTGTLVTELKPGKRQEFHIVELEDGTREGIESSKFRVKYDPVPPWQFLIEPGAKGCEAINDSLGVAREIDQPLHKVKSLIKDGIYRDVDITKASEDTKDLEDQKHKKSEHTDIVNTIKYFGKAPRQLIEAIVKSDAEVEGEDDDIKDLIKTLDELESDGDSSLDFDDNDLVEAVIVIGNNCKLLKATENKFLTKDRPFSMSHWDFNPEESFGRGVSDKGYGSQQALDAELRSRIDVIGLIAHPMMAVNRLGLMKGQNLSVRPGKNIYTTEDPNSVLSPIKFGNLDASSFPQSADLERQLQMATGSVDTAAPVDVVQRNQTASGMSMIQGSFVKRTKRILRRIESHYLSDLIQKTYRFYVQFDPNRYSIIENNFFVKSGIGVVARELEQQQLTNLLSITSPDSPVFNVILKGIFENSSLNNKKELLLALEQANTPDPQQQQQAQQQLKLELAKAQAELARSQASAKKDNAIGLFNEVSAKVEMGKLQLADRKQENDFAIDSAKIKADIFDTNKKSETEIIRERMRLISRNQEVSQKEAANAQREAEKGKNKAQEPSLPTEINLVTKPSKKKIIVKRTGDGLEGTSEDIGEE